MKALVFQNNNLELAQEHPIPDVGCNDALIKVIAAGICNTDLEIIKGYMNFSGIIGHEFVGRVIKSRDTRLCGKRVVGQINCGCGKCPLCIKGLDKHCPNRTVLGILGRNGAMAEYVCLPNKNLRLLPDNVSDLQAVFVEPLAAAYEILEQAAIKPDQSVLLLGDGKLGQLIAQVIRLAGCKLTAAGKHPEKLALLDACGIKTVILEQLDVDNRLYDIVIDASGSASGLKLALKHVSPCGKIILKTTTANKNEIDILNKIVIDEVTLIGSRCGPYPPAIKALAANLINVSPLVTSQYSLSQ